MMESDLRRCRSCGDQLEADSEAVCPDCVSQLRWKDLLSFRSDLSQLVENFPKFHWAAWLRESQFFPR